MGLFSSVLVSWFVKTRGDTDSPRDPILGLTQIRWGGLFFFGLPIVWALADAGLVPSEAFPVALLIIIVGAILASNRKP